MSCSIQTLLARAGRLLLEYNESTEQISRDLTAIARALTDRRCEIVVSYAGLAVELTGEQPLLMPVREFRYNAALQARVHLILRRVQSKQIDPSAAILELQRVEAATPSHPRWLTILLLGFAATGLAALLGADFGTLVVAGLATSLGVAVRQELGRRQFSLLTLPFAAGFVGAAVGGLAIRFGWTRTPELAVIVPSLMLVPGPHLINGLLDLVDNHVPMSIARLALASSILVAIAFGVVLGVALSLAEVPPVNEEMSVEHLNAWVDIVLAAIATIGFAAYYNTAWAHVAMATLGGMAGHGVRFLALEMNWGLISATFIGSFVVGVISAWIAQLYKVPLAVIAFAGAVTMMPGLQIYRALGGCLKLARLHGSDSLPIVAETLGNASEAWLVVIALAIGLVMASRAVSLVTGDLSPNHSSNLSDERSK